MLIDIAFDTAKGIKMVNPRWKLLDYRKNCITREKEERKGT